MIKKWQTIEVGFEGGLMLVFHDNQLSDEEVFRIEDIWGYSTHNGFLVEMGNLGWEPCASSCEVYEGSYYLKRDANEELKIWDLVKVGLGGVSSCSQILEKDINKINEISKSNAKDAFLAKMGRLGWEIWNVTNTSDGRYYYFKREA